MAVRFSRRYATLVAAVLAPLAVCGVLVPFRSGLANTNVALVLVVVVVVVAATGHRLAGALAALFAAVWFDVFFTLPYEQLTIAGSADIQAAVKKNGFSSFDEYTAVADNISLILAGIDPETKQFSEPKDAIQKDIADTKADTDMSPEEKKQALEELEEALKTAEPIKYPGNIELVKKYYDRLDELMQ